MNDTVRSQGGQGREGHVTRPAVAPSPIYVIPGRVFSRGVTGNERCAKDLPLVLSPFTALKSSGVTGFEKNFLFYAAAYFPASRPKITALPKAVPVM